MMMMMVEWWLRKKGRYDVDKMGEREGWVDVGRDEREKVRV